MLLVSLLFFHILPELNSGTCEIKNNYFVLFDTVFVQWIVVNILHTNNTAANC